MSPFFFLSYQEELRLSGKSSYWAKLCPKPGQPGFPCASLHVSSPCTYDLAISIQKWPLGQDYTKVSLASESCHTRAQGRGSSPREFGGHSHLLTAKAHLLGLAVDDLKANGTGLIQWHQSMRGAVKGKGKSQWGRQETWGLGLGPPRARQLGGLR